MAAAIAQWDITLSDDPAVHEFFKAGPAGIPTQVAFSQATRWPTLDTDRAEGCIRSLEHAYSSEGGLAVLHGNIAVDGCVVKTSGVDDSILVFEGPAPLSAKARTMRSPILDGESQRRRCRRNSLRGSERRPRHAGNVVPDQLFEIEGLG